MSNPTPSFTSLIAEYMPTNDLFENKNSEDNEPFTNLNSPGFGGIDLTLSYLAKKAVSRIAPPTVELTESLSRYKIKDKDNDILNRHINLLCSSLECLTVLEPKISEHLKNEREYQCIISRKNRPLPQANTSDEEPLKEDGLCMIEHVKQRTMPERPLHPWACFHPADEEEDKPDSPDEELSIIEPLKQRTSIIGSRAPSRWAKLKHKGDSSSSDDNGRDDGSTSSDGRPRLRSASTWCPARKRSKADWKPRPAPEGSDSWRRFPPRPKKTKKDSSSGDSTSYERFAGLFKTPNKSSKSTSTVSSCSSNCHVETKHTCCPEGHILIENQCSGTVTCEKCKKDFVQGTKMYSCRIDDFDECESCYLDRLVSLDGTLFIDPKRGQKKKTTTSKPNSIRPAAIARGVDTTCANEPIAAKREFGSRRPRLRNTKSEEIIYKRGGRETVIQSRWVPTNDAKSGETQWKRVFNEEPDKMRIEIVDEARQTSVILSCHNNMRVGELFALVNRLSHGSHKRLDELTFNLFFDCEMLDPNSDVPIESMGIRDGSKVQKKRTTITNQASTTLWTCS